MFVIEKPSHLANKVLSYKNNQGCKDGTVNSVTRLFVILRKNQQIPAIILNNTNSMFNILNKGKNHDMEYSEDSSIKISAS